MTFFALALLLLSLDVAHAAKYVKAYGKDQGFRGITGPYDIAFSPDDKHGYIASDKGNSLVVAKRNEKTGSLKYVQKLSNENIKGGYGLQGARTVHVASSGKFVLTTGCYDDALVVFKRNEDNGKLKLVDVAYHNATEHGQGPDQHDKRGLNGVWHFKISPDDKFVYLAGYEENTLGVWSLSPEGKLAHVQSLVHRETGEEDSPEWDERFDGLGGVRTIEISADGKFLYAASFDSMILSVFPRDPETGLLGRQVQQVQNGVPEGMMGIDGAFALVQNPLPGNPYLYLASWTWSQENPAASSGKGFDSSVTVLKRDAETGHVTFVECLHDGIDGVVDMMGACAVDVTQDGKWLAVGSMWDHSLHIYEIDADDGTLMLDHISKNDRDGAILKSPHGVRFSKNGADLYVASTRADAISHFKTELEYGEQEL